MPGVRNGAFDAKMRTIENFRKLGVKFFCMLYQGTFFSLEAFAFIGQQFLHRGELVLSLGLSFLLLGCEPLEFILSGNNLSTLIRQCGFLRVTVATMRKYPANPTRYAP